MISQYSLSSLFGNPSREENDGAHTESANGQDELLFPEGHEGSPAKTVPTEGTEFAHQKIDLGPIQPTQSAIGDNPSEKDSTTLETPLGRRNNKPSKDSVPEKGTGVGNKKGPRDFSTHSTQKN